jgi:large subunit ribosomal protein L4
MADVKAALFSVDGERTGEVTLDPEIFGIEPNLAVLHQVVTAQLAGARSGTSSTKTRSEVRGGGRKPWRQKGLGRARAGSIRSPLFRGGGVAHGPKPRSYEQRTPKKMKRLALRSALSVRAGEDAVLVVDELSWSAPKTAQAAGLLREIGADGKTLIVLSAADQVAEKAFRNLPSIMISRPDHLTAYDVLWANQLVFTNATVGSVGRAHSYDVAVGDFVKEGEAT